MRKDAGFIFVVVIALFIFMAGFISCLIPAPVKACCESEEDKKEYKAGPVPETKSVVIYDKIDENTHSATIIDEPVDPSTLPTKETPVASGDTSNDTGGGGCKG
jgi:hypothetical protein